MQDGKVVGITGTRLFILDTGSESSYLTDHYLAEHPDMTHGPPHETARLAGAGGVREIPAYGAQALPLAVGNKVMLLNGQHILTEPAVGEAEHYFGVIGQDLLRTFGRYTIDFRTGAFSVGT